MFLPADDDPIGLADRPVATGRSDTIARRRTVEISRTLSGSDQIRDWMQ
ncbi:MAG: hypothetical protein QM766_11050 [Burkholderiaceae bacterium]